MASQISRTSGIFRVVLFAVMGIVSLVVNTALQSQLFEFATPPTLPTNGGASLPPVLPVENASWRQSPPVNALPPPMRTSNQSLPIPPTNVSSLAPTRHSNVSLPHMAPKDASLLPMPRPNASLSVPMTNRSRTGEFFSNSTSLSRNESCEIFSADWRLHKRHGNILIPNATEELLQSWLVDYSTHLLLPSSIGPAYTTICTPESDFKQPLSLLDDAANNITATSLRHWYIRLLFAVFYHHQHGPARDAARQRLLVTVRGNATPCHDQDVNESIGNFDYECRHTRFLVVQIGGNGLGANLRGALVKVLLAGIMSNRVVLFINDQNWPLASCSRRDWQCVMQPLSPCVITRRDLDTAIAIENADLLHFIDGQLTLTHHNYTQVSHHRVFRADAHIMGMKSPLPRALHQKIHARALALINELPNFAAGRNVTTHKAQLQMAANLLLSNGKDQSSRSLETDIFDVGLVFLLRPNVGASANIRTMLSSIWPSNFDADHSLGLPIRASDKCNRESQCLTFDQHLQVGAKSWHQWGSNASQPFVMITSESQEMKHAYHNFTRTNTSATHALWRTRHPPHLFTNAFDVTPGTGKLDLRRRNRSSAPPTFDEDQATLSALTTFHLQLHARVTVGNCCSSFHVTLMSAFRVGCGNNNNHFHCLQHDDDPLYAICCIMGPREGSVMNGVRRWGRDCASERTAALQNRTDS